VPVAGGGHIRFFASGLEVSATEMHHQMLALLDVQGALKGQVRESPLRTDSAQTLVDYAVGHVAFMGRSVQRDPGLSYGSSNTLVNQLVDLGLLRQLDPGAPKNRRSFWPLVLDALTSPLKAEHL
jgi:hypothetical protein